MSEFAGASDPARSLALLWRTSEKTSRKGKPELSVRRIATAAVALADREGLAGLAMRRVAEELGVGTMSLYTYVPGKPELLDVMFDLVHGETLTEHDEQPDRDRPGWRARLTAVAERNWQLHQRHPWLLALATGRAVLGPNVIAKYDAELRAVDGIGLSDVEMDLVLTLVLDHARAAARTAVESRQVAERTGLSDEQWWSASAPLLEAVFDPARFPVAARVGRAAGEEFQAPASPRHTFAFGLARLLDGIAALLRDRGVPG